MIVLLHKKELSTIYASKTPIADAESELYFPNMAAKFVLKNSLPKSQTTENPVIGEYIFDGSIFTIGSDAANNLVLPEAAPEQLVVMREDERLTLINSSEGTHLNDVVLRREAIEPLANGDDIKVGNYVISVIDGINFPADGTAVNDKNNIDNVFSSEIISNKSGKTNAIALLSDSAESSKESVAESEAPRSFADVLNTLRTEEDSFYFIRQNGTGETVHVPLEDAETPIGETDGGDIAFNIGEISTLYAVARKDWSGILLESQRRNSVLVNDETVETTRRLRNDDRVSFPARSKISLVLHEPSSLVALESLLSARVDSNTARFGGLAAKNAGAAENQAVVSQTTKQTASTLERKYFSHFSFVEIVSMIIGTLIGAVLIFLFLEIVFS